MAGFAFVEGGFVGCCEIEEDFKEGGFGFAVLEVGAEEEEGDGFGEGEEVVDQDYDLVAETFVLQLVALFHYPHQQTL